MTRTHVTTHPADGTVDTLADGRRVLRYERRLAHPVDRVWSAITRPAELRAWLADADVDLAPGGAVQLRWLNHDDRGNRAVMNGTITALEPPRVLEIASDIHGVLRWELTEDDAGTALAFTVTIGPDVPVGLVRAGWHIHLEHLAGALDGRPVDWPRWGEEHRPRWNEIARHYEAEHART
jgi:uncharacterized protein YndB with AHSA1/START domain